MAAHIARRDWAASTGSSRTLAQSTAVIVAGAATIWAAAVALQTFGYRLGGRFLDPLPLALLLASIVATHLPYCLIIYLRAHKREPLFPAYIAQGVLTVASQLPSREALRRARRRRGLPGGDRARVHHLVGRRLRRKRREWHTDAPGEVTGGGA